MKYRVTDTTKIRPGLQIIWLDRKQEFEDFLKKKVIISTNAPIEYHSQHDPGCITIENDEKVLKNTEIQFV